MLLGKNVELIGTVLRGAYLAKNFLQHAHVGSIAKPYAIKRKIAVHVGNAARCNGVVKQGVAPVCAGVHTGLGKGWTCGNVACMQAGERCHVLRAIGGFLQGF